MNQERKKKQDLGIFYTRPEIVDFIYDILLLWKDKEDKEHRRWKSHKPKHHPSVIDPACGEGVFLKKAVEKGFTKADWIFGLDIDEAVVKKWPEISLLDAFDGSDNKLQAHFFHQNGLKRIEWNQHKKQYYGKLKKDDIEKEQFNLVVGNPPYGGTGLEKEEFDDALIEHLGDYNILPSELRKELENKNKLGAFDFFEKGKSKSIDPKVKDRLKSFPIEVLFLDRFIQLCKPGGWIAIIIPDGILTNSNLHYVRKYIAENTKVEAVVSLPRDAFKHVGTTAKTSILFLTKQKTEDQNYPVFLASLERMENGHLNKILSHYKEFYMKQALNKEKNVYTNDFVMVRADKTLKNIMEEKPASRWDAEYWNVRFDYLLSIFHNWNARTLEDIEGKDCIISGDHVRPSRGESKGFKLKTGLEYYETKNFLFTGYDYSEIKECSKNAYERLKYTAVQQHDILISCAGVGGVGKGRICLVNHRPKEKSCTGDVFIIRLKKVNPFWAYILFNSIIGKDQILRNKSGVGTVNINTDQVLSLNIPMLPPKIQTHIESEYKKMSVFHDKAMAAKAKGDEAGYKKNIEIAKTMLKDLIAKTEAVIRGEREDVM